MINLGLSSADHDAYGEALRNSHRIRITAYIHDQNERLIETLHTSILSGSVQVDAAQAGATRKIVKGNRFTSAQPSQSATGPVRTLSLTCLRPRKNPVWMPHTPGNSTVFADNFISVKYGVWVRGLADGSGWVDVPVFWGPITGIEQDGDQVTISASGKEVLALDPCLLWETIKVAKGRHRVSAIRELLRAQGERRFDFGEFTDRLTADHVAGRYSQPWVSAIGLARAGNFQLFYDGLGKARMRQWPKNRAWTFKDGNDGTLLSRPSIVYDISSARNTIEVVGRTPKGAKTHIRAVARPPAFNPLSPESLSRNGQPRFMVYSEQDNADLVDAAKETADELLFELLTAQINVSFDSMVIPHLEEGDRVAVMADGALTEFVLTQFTIPLTSTDTMSVGVNRRVQWKQRARVTHTGGHVWKGKRTVKAK